MDAVSPSSFYDQRRVWRALGLTLEARGVEPQGHTDRIVMLAVSIAAELGLSEEEIQAIEVGAYLHDLGKLDLPRHLLQETQMLSENQWRSIRAHVDLGIDLLGHLDLPKTSLDLVLYHHERWDGTGYPKGLHGLEIPLSARLFAVVDAFVAMTADWWMRRAISGTGALYELWNERGTAFEPRMVDALGRVLRLMVSPDQNYKNIRQQKPHREKINQVALPSQAQFALLDERGYVCYASPMLLKHLDPLRSTLLDILELVDAEKRPQLLAQVQEVRHSFHAALEMNTQMKHTEAVRQHIETKLINDEFGEGGLVLLWIEPDQIAQPTTLRPSDIFRQALISSDAAVILTDHQQRILEVSPAFLRTTGYHITDVLGRTPRMLQGVRSSREALDLLKNGIERGEPCQTEVINYRKDGTEFWSQISVTPIYASDGSIPYFISLQHDVSSLRKQHVEQHRLLEMVQDAIVVTDLSGLVTYANVHAEAMFGATMGHAVWAKLESDNAQKVKEAIQQLTFTSQPMPLETRAYPDANWSRYLTWNISVSLTEQRLYWVGHDTTELRLIGLKQQRQHQFVSSILDSSTSLVVVCNAQGNVVRLNQTIGQKLNVDTQRALGTHVTELIPLNDKAMENLKLFLANPKDAATETVAVIPVSGEQRQVAWTVKTIIGNSSKEIEFLVFTGTDLTERLLQEAQLRDSEHRYRTVVESINDAILRIDPQGRATYANPAWKRLSGYGESTTLNSSSVLKFVHGSHRSMVFRQITRAVKQQQPSLRLEMRLVSRASRLRWIEATLHFRYEQAALVGITAMVTDITDSKEKAVQYHVSHSQNKFYNADDLNAALLALSQFLGAKEAQIIAPDLYISTQKSETIVFQPDLDTVLSQDSNSVLKLESVQGLSGFLTMRWNDVGHLAESITLLEYKAQFTEALERVLAYRFIIEREERSKQFIEVTLRAQEAERERIAIDLHDGPAQTMVSALRFIETSLETSEIENSTLKKQLERSLELIGSSIRQIRETITDLIPPDLEILGLRDVLRQRLEEMARSENWQTDFHFDPVRLARDAEVTLYRIVIEALNNTRRHAKASHVRLYLWHDKYTTILEIQDNGIGFDPEKPPQPKLHQGVGTIGMKKRAELLGAQLSVHSTAGSGTTVRFVMPNHADPVLMSQFYASNTSAAPQRIDHA